MSFLTPTLLWGALAAGIPIAIHLFFRSRYRTVPWAAMKFLLTSIEETSRRLKFQELFLLLARVALLILLALALARPFSSLVRGSGQGEAVDAVMLFDVSYSMGASDGAMSRLGRAQDAAVKILDQLPPHSTVQIIAGADRAATLGPRDPSNLEQAKQIIRDLKVTALATDFSPGLQESLEALKRGQASNKEFYFFSDLQELGWSQKSSETVTALQRVKDIAAVTLVRCGQKSLKNVALVGIAAQSGVPRPGERVDFGLLVRNTGVEDVENLEVTLTVDGDPKSIEIQSIPKISPGETRAVTLTGKMEKAGLRVLSAQVKHDDLAGDNHFEQVMPVRENVQVLIVDGGLHKDRKTPSSFYLQHALAPVRDADRSKYYLQPQVVLPTFASPGHLDKKQICFLVNVALEDGKLKQGLSPDFVERLNDFVRQGGALVIVPGDNLQPDAYNRMLGAHGLLPLKLKKPIDISGKDPLYLNRESFNLAAFSRFKEDKLYRRFNEIEVMKLLDTEEFPKGDEKEGINESVIALRTSDGRPALATRRVGAGEVVLLGTNLDFDHEDFAGAWTDWPLRLHVFVPFVDVLMSHLLQGLTEKHNVVAGQTLTWYAKDREPRAYTLVRPDGKKIPLGLPENKEGRPVIVADDVPLAGLYQLTRSAPPSSVEAGKQEPIEEPGIPIAAVADLRESESLVGPTDAQIDEKLGFTPIHLTAGTNEVASTGVDRLNREWTMWWIVALLALLVGEAFLASWCDRAW